MLDSYIVVKSEKFSNSVAEFLMVQIQEINTTIVNLYRPLGSSMVAFQEALEKVAKWLEGNRSTVL